MSEPIVLGIHGLLNKPSAQQLEQWWGEALAEGLRLNLEGDVPPPAFRLAYWADIRNPQPVSLQELEEPYNRAEAPPARYEARKRDKVRAFLSKWGGRTIDKGKDLLGDLTEDRGRERLEELLGLGLGDLSAYYTDETIRRAMRGRLSTLLAEARGRRILLIAHSMGSIIAYDVLREMEASSDVAVEHLVTAGSPLGLPFVGERIDLDFGGRTVPKNVRRWTNIADPGDKVALDCQLTDEFEPRNTIVDVLVNNDYVGGKGDNPHKSYGYLRAPELSDEIARFIG